MSTKERHAENQLCSKTILAVQPPVALAAVERSSDAMSYQSFRRLHDLLGRQAIASPDKIGLVSPEIGPVDYRAWAAETVETAEWLSSRGVRPGHRVMVVAENGHAFPCLAFACARIDAWCMPVNARQSSGEIERLIAHADPALIVFTVDVSQPAMEHARRLGAAKADRTVFLERPGTQTEPVEEPGDRQIAALMYTTGTTGNPKGVMLTHTNLAWYAVISATFRDLGPADYTYCPLPLTHIYGYGNALLGNVYAGSTLEIATRFDPEAVFDAIDRGATVLPAVPAMYAHLLDYAEARGWKTAPDHQLRYIMTGGAPLDPDWKRRVEAFFNLPLNNGYGMTECSPGIASSKGVAFDPRRPDDVSCGEPLPGLSVRIVPPAGQRELADGVGEVTVKGPNVMVGYYRNPEATAEVLEPDGTFHTGDLGHFDERGRLHLDGRSKELIIRSGFNVYPPEVEAALTKHPAVTLAGVIGRKVPGNEEVLAFVQKVPGAIVNEDELKAFVRAELAPYKCPSRIVVTDELPVSSANKVLKHKLLETFAALC